jgi:hypothetical protein
MPGEPSQVEGVEQETLDRIRNRVLEKEEEQADYKQVHNLRPKLKEIVEQEITEENLDS